MIRYLEIYQCFQGEGTRTGEPSVLIRLFGCNALCSWCDTKYSINPKLHAELGGPPIQTALPGALANYVNGHWSRIRNIIISGGEPTIQSELAELIGSFHDLGKFVTIETNGTRFVDDRSGHIDDELILWSISPKPPGAMTEAWDEEAIYKYLAIYPRAVQLKFVISDARDFEFVRGFLLRTDRKSVV